jgi:aminopeptidase N
MINVSNGRLRNTTRNPDGTTTYEWFVVNPINNYSIVVNAGSYAHYSDLFQGERGELTLEYWPLDYNLEAARRQFPQVISTLECFEHWFGPYPWYEDGFQLVEVRTRTGTRGSTCLAPGSG